MELILASTSPYRRRLLERLQLDFRCEAPGVDESRVPAVGPEQLAGHLAQAKAREVAARHPRDLVLGSDQVAALGKRILGKPGDFQRARRQLLACSGRTVHFYTGVALIRQDPVYEAVRVESFEVRFRKLEPAAVEDYLQREEPYDCAGSFKWEGLGISLFQRLTGDDPTTLEGLPLIALCDMLSEAGIQVLQVQ